MTSAQVFETSVTNKGSFQNYPHQNDCTIRTTDTPGLTAMIKKNNKKKKKIVTIGLLYYTQVSFISQNDYPLTIT